MSPLTSFFNRKIKEYVIKHKSTLLQKTPIKDYLHNNDDDYVRWAAYSSLKDSPLDVGTDDNLYIPMPNYGKIPHAILVSLKAGKFDEYSVKYTTRQMREKIQHKFTYGNPDEADEYGRYSAGYKEIVNSQYEQKANEYIKGKLTSISVLLAIILTIVGLGGHAYLKHQADVKYWASINTPQSFTGDGYTEKFPCSQVVTRTDSSGPDLSSNTSSCEYFGGGNHQSIDLYQITVDHFLTSKYSPVDQVACGNPMTYTGSADTQVYYNETRTRDGYTWILCGKGQAPITARLKVDSTVYTLVASPSIEKNTAADLDNLIRGFQLN